MALSIAILEDNEERVAAMRSRIHERFPQYELNFFSSSDSMVQWLTKNLASTIALSLDNDLEPQLDANGDSCDSGTGRDVEAYLLTQTPVCPVVVHSSNYIAAMAMEANLQDAGWPTVRVMPYDDLAWIEADWFIAMRNALVSAPIGVPASQGISFPN